jgi:hypothetical protein
MDSINSQAMLFGPTVFLYTLLSQVLIYTWKNVIPALVSYCGYGWQELSGNKMQKMQKKVVFSTSKACDGQNMGWIAGKWFFGFIGSKYSSDGGNMFIFGSHKLVEELDDKRSIDSEENFTEDESGDIMQYYHEGKFGYYHWCSNKIYPYKMIANGSQMCAIEAIRDNYKSTFFNETKNYCVAMLYGGPGKGKSSIGIILANILAKEGKSVNFIDCYDPLTPGEPFSKVYNRIAPDEKSPMIIMLEEFDTIISKFKTGIPEHKENSRMIHDKATWNSFFDKFGKGSYKHVYFLMTTNKAPEWFDGEDNTEPGKSSFIREGRVDVKIGFDL